MPHPIVHFEIGCSDIQVASDFYRAVFGWRIRRNGTSASIDTGLDGAIPGHLNQLGPDEPEHYITLYIQTDTLDEHLERIVALGGEVLVGPIALPDGRRFAWFADVAGNTVGLITPQPEDQELAVGK